MIIMCRSTVKDYYVSVPVRKALLNNQRYRWTLEQCLPTVFSSLIFFLWWLLYDWCRCVSWCAIMSTETQRTLVRIKFKSLKLPNNSKAKKKWRIRCPYLWTNDFHFPVCVQLSCCKRYSAVLTRLPALKLTNNSCKRIHCRAQYSKTNVVRSFNYHHLWWSLFLHRIMNDFRKIAYWKYFE